MSERITDKHVFFFRAASRYSQWYRCTFSLDIPHLGTVEVNCAEQAMMLWKAAMFGDFVAVAKIATLSDPWAQKSAGRGVRRFDKARWEAQAPAIVTAINYAKFTSDNALLVALLADGAGRHFVEASPTDTIWGVGLALDDPRIDDPTNWRGTNYITILDALTTQTICGSRARGSLRRRGRADAHRSGLRLGRLGLRGVLNYSGAVQPPVRPRYALARRRCGRVQDANL